MHVSVTRETIRSRFVNAWIAICKGRFRSESESESMFPTNDPRSSSRELSTISPTRFGEQTSERKDGGRNRDSVEGPIDERNRWNNGKNTTHRPPGYRRLRLPPCPCSCSCRAFSSSPRLVFFLQTQTYTFSLCHTSRFVPSFSVTGEIRNECYSATNLLICASSPLPWSFLPRVLPPLRTTTRRLFGARAKREGRGKQTRPSERKRIKK